MNDIIKAEIVDVCPSPYGYAIFLKTSIKTFVIYMDRCRGVAVESALQNINGQRPLTHEFIVQMLDGFDCTVKNALIYHENEGTFFTRLTIEMENELGRKIIEIDARPSDSFPICLRVGAPIYISSEILELQPDMADALRKIKGV